MNRRSIRSLALVLGIASLVMPSLASAKSKVALTPIEGDPSGDLVDAVADALDGGDLAVIAQKTVTRAVDKLGYDGELTEKQAKKVGSELEADAVVQAKLDKQGSRKQLHFKLFVRGKKAGGFKITFTNAKSKKFKTMLRDKMVAKIASQSEEREEEEAAEPEPKAKKPKTKVAAEEVEGEDPVADKKPKKGGKKAEGEEPTEKAVKQETEAASEDPDKAEAEGDEDARPRKKKKVARVDGEEIQNADPDMSVRKRSDRAANRVAFRVDVGVSVANRTLRFNNRPDFPEAPKPYANSPVPAARFEAEIYPLAFTAPKSFAAGLGLAAEYDKTLALNLTTQEGVRKTNQQHYSFGARFRVMFGSKPTSPSMTVGVGYGRRTFKPDRTGLMDPRSIDFPDTNYKMIDPGISFRIPLVSSIALTMGGKGLVIMDAGAIQKANSYGQARVFGGSAQAGVDIVLANRFAIRIVGEYVKVGFEFRNKGEEANNRDGNPDTEDVGGAADRSYGGAVTLAVLY